MRRLVTLAAPVMCCEAQTGDMAFQCQSTHWQALRSLVGIKPDSSGLLYKVALDSPHSRWYAKASARIQKGIHHDLRIECLPGVWVLQMLEAELKMQDHVSRSLSDNTSNVLDLLISVVDAVAAETLLGRLFLPGTKGEETSWHTLGTSDWSLFRLAARFRNNIVAAFAEQREELLSEMSAHFGVWWLSCSRALENGVHSLLVVCEGQGGSEAQLAATLTSLSTTLGQAQTLLLSWVAHAMSFGFSRSYILAAILLLDCRSGLLEELDRQFLSDTVLMQLPRAFHRSLQPRVQASQRWKSSNCGRSPHGMNLMGTPKLAHAFVAAASARNGLTWRCGVAMRVLRTRESFMSDLVRRRGFAACALGHGPTGCGRGASSEICVCPSGR